MQEFRKLLQPVTKAIAGVRVDAALENHLNSNIPGDGTLFKQIESACHQGIAEGWMCAKGGEGRRFGRVIEPSAETGNLSVDVVELDSVAGPHHAHPKGEICMIMPQDESATFDGNGTGWCVNPSGSAHFPTVRGGKALILYLLPDGEIEFTGKPLPKNRT